MNSESVLSKPPISKTRSTHRAPQPYVMNLGDVIIYATWRGDTLNPYLARNKQLVQGHRLRRDVDV